MKKFEHYFERLLFSSRWLMAPVYLGLVLALMILLVNFGQEVYLVFSELNHSFAQFDHNTEGKLITGVLSLVDLTLVMNLLIIIIFSGYENFVSKMDDLHDHEDRPEWMGNIGFSDLKIKLIGSMVAISGIELLKAFMVIETYQDRHLYWMVGIHVTFLFSGLFYALMDRMSAKH